LGKQDEVSLFSFPLPLSSSCRTISLKVRKSFFTFLLKVGSWGGIRTLNPLRAGDFLTTTTFVATYSVCSLDYIFTIAFALGAWVSSLYGVLFPVPSVFPSALSVKASPISPCPPLLFPIMGSIDLEFFSL